jgi:hypothetical protein
MRIRIFGAPSEAFCPASVGDSGPRGRRQPVTEASREVVNCVALPQRNIQNLCGTIIFSAIVRPHGISSIV